MPRILALPKLQEIEDLLQYDYKSGDLCWRKAVGSIKAGSNAGCIERQKHLSYFRVTIKRNRYFAHRLCWLLHTGDDPGAFWIDHLDGNGLNNAFSNLRLATTAENGWNARRCKHNTSGYKGVCWVQTEGRWSSRITFNNRRLFLGYFDTPELAHMAYCKAAAELHGEFARGA